MSYLCGGVDRRGESCAAPCPGRKRAQTEGDDGSDTGEGKIVGVVGPDAEVARQQQDSSRGEVAGTTDRERRSQVSDYATEIVGCSAFLTFLDRGCLR